MSDGQSPRRGRKTMALRLDAAVHGAIASWAAAELRSVNAHIEWILRRALAEEGRMPQDAGPAARRGRPPRHPPPSGAPPAGRPPGGGDDRSGPGTPDPDARP